MAPNLLRLAGQAVALNAVANWIALLGSTLSTVVIARILSPDDYGVFVMALIAISLPEVIASGTLTDSIVQRKQVRPGHVNSVFLQSMVLAIASWLLLILLAPLIAEGFRNPDVVPVLVVCGAMLPIGAMMSVPSSLLQRELRYKEITLVDVLGTVVASITGVILALAWRNEWALVGMEMARRLVRLVGFLFFARWVPGVASNWQDFRELARFNVTNGASKMLQTLDGMMPKTLIGATLGSSAVGLFNLPERLFVQAYTALIAPFAAVAMPVASAMQESRPSLHQAMENAIRTAAFLSYPTFVGGFVIAPYAIPMVFGEKWAPSIPIFQVYMVIGLRAPITAIISGVLRGVGRPDVVIWITVGSLVSSVVFLLSAYQYGLTAIALALLGKQVVTFSLSTWLVRRIVGLSIGRQFKAGATAFFASLIMGAIVWAFITFVPAGDKELLHLATAIVLGAVSYALALFGLSPRLGMQVVHAAGMVLRGHPGKAVQLVRTALAQQNA